MKCHFDKIAATVFALLLSLFLSEQAIGQACSLSASAAKSGRVPCSQILQSSNQTWMDQGYLREIYFLDRILGVNPSFRLCQEVRGPNAFASPEVVDPTYPDGTVYFGVALAR